MDYARLQIYIIAEASFRAAYSWAAYQRQPYGESVEKIGVNREFNVLWEGRAYALLPAVSPLSV